MRFWICGVLAVFVAAFQSIQTLGAASSPNVTAAGSALFPSPRWLPKQCHDLQARVSFRVLCPTRLPHARDGTAPTGVALSSSGAHGKWIELVAQYGTPTDPQSWALNNPSYFFHLIMLEGPVPANDLELGTAMRVGRRSLAGHSGVLYREPSWASCHCAQGGHLIFIWTEKRTQYVVSLHRWLFAPTLTLMGMLIKNLRQP